MEQQRDGRNNTAKETGVDDVADTPRAMAERLKAAGVEVCMVVGPQDKDDACLDWVGAVLSLTGAVKGLPALAQAVRDGVFHPGCRHSLTSFDPKKTSASRAREAEIRTVHAIQAMNARARGEEPPPLAVRRYIQEINSKEKGNAAGANNASERDRLKFERVYESARKARGAGDLDTFRLKCRAALDILRETDIYGSRQAQLMALLERSLGNE